MDPTRRAFLRGLGATVALAACKHGGASAAERSGDPLKGPQPGAPAEGAFALPPPKETANKMPRRPLGSTGLTVSLVGLGGYHIGIAKSDAESIRIIRAAIDRGVTFLDNCWDYNAGKSEELMGRALADGYRGRVVLMTKIDGRTSKAAADQIDQSLKRLRTDTIDLVQIHEVIRPEDPARCFGDGGCIDALVRAKQAGKLRFVGFTGHKDPSIHLAMLQAADDHGFRFDTVQMPLNVMDAHFRSFEKRVLPVLQQKKIGVIGMKAMGSGLILESKTVTPIECLHYAMSLPVSVVVTGCETMGVLEQAVHAAITWRPLASDAVADLLRRTAGAAKDGKYEAFKTTGKFDGTNQHPGWLESATI